ncbi:Ig-like domain-containing protein [Myxococcus sp. K38C18041901]|uniref:Ig-like domain-containing protein n=1 Tax=Myxococcus guangdongensis TaxID=2906760 RepID=UPI0020A6E11F|nr:Ig-like domain-containing protein [Myxococcus guangdongensis]MCP3065496.1 Ig-like domain-containing protein [Myxococcus guangdongensis]
MVPDAGVPTVGARLILSRQTTNGGVDVQAELTGASPEKVELLVDGSAVETMLPPYKLRLDTQALIEGDHELRVRTTLGGNVSLSEPSQLTVDRTPPVLMSRVPAPGDLSVPAGQVVRVEFSEALEPETVHAGSVRLEVDSKIVAGDVTLSADGRGVTISPVGRLPKDVAIQVVLDVSVTDLAGNSIQRGDEWRWTVPGFLPLGNALASAPPQYSTPSFPEVLAQTSGMPLVAWGDSGSGGVFIHQWTGAAWELMGGTPLRVAGRVSSFNARLDEAQHPVVGWLDDELGEVHVRRWTGSEWVSMGGVIRAPKTYCWGLSLRTNGAGRWFVSFAIREEFFVYEWDGTTWLQRGLFRPADNWGVASTAMELDEGGNPVVIWGEMNAAGDTIRYETRWWSQGEWKSAASSLGHPSGWAWGVGAPGRPLVAIHDAAEIDVWEWRSTAWRELGTAFEERFPGGARAEVRRFALDSSGALVVLLGEPEAAGQPETLHMRKLVGSEWVPLEGLLRPPPGLTPNPASRFVITPDGRTLVARIESAGQPPNEQHRIQVYISND